MLHQLALGAAPVPAPGSAPVLASDATVVPAAV